MIVKSGFTATSFRLLDVVKWKKCKYDDRLLFLDIQADQLIQNGTEEEKRNGRQLRTQYRELKDQAIAELFENTEVAAWLRTQNIEDYKVTAGLTNFTEAWLYFYHKSDAMLFKLTWMNGKYS